MCLYFLSFLFGWCRRSFSLSLSSIVQHLNLIVTRVKKSPSDYINYFKQYLYKKSGFPKEGQERSKIYKIHSIFSM